MTLRRRILTSLVLAGTALLAACTSSEKLQPQALVAPSGAVELV